MSDVFISYSRKDRDRVTIIAAALEAEGLDVWWDPNILPGTTFDEIIDKELVEAKCVIVVWSHASIKSRWVREEANDALEREILIPVRIDAVPLPRGFKLVQTEELTDWDRSRTAECWQRIMLQAKALTQSEHSKVNQPPPDVDPATPPRLPTPSTNRAAEQQVLNSAIGKPIPPAAQTAAAETAIAPASELAGESDVVQTLARSPRSGSRALVPAVVLALVLICYWGIGSIQNSSVLSSTLALAAMSFLLFYYADGDLSPGMKAIASRWVLPVDGAVKISTTEAFNTMFEAVFGRRHLTWRCFWRSAVASIVSYIVLLSIILATSKSSASTQLFGGKEMGAVIVGIIIWGSINIFGDYFALFSTRIMLSLSAKRPYLLLPVAILDSIITAPLWFVGIFPAVVLTLLPIQASGLTQGMPPFDFVKAHLGQGSEGLFIGASIATTYVTSAWLWLCIILVPTARILVWSRKTGLTGLGRVLDAQQRPFIALGFITAGMILVIGCAIWALGHASAR